MSPCRGTPAAYATSTPAAYHPTGPGRMPIRIAPEDGEALDGYLERVAAANHLDNPALLRLITPESAESTAFLPIKPNPSLVGQLSTALGIDEEQIARTTLEGTASPALNGLDPTDLKTWRAVAAHGWAPGRGTQICARCLQRDGIWRIAWRHPWVTVCLKHATWLVGTCPTCGMSFRSQRHPLRSVDANHAICGNPRGHRGRPCDQQLATLGAEPAPADVLDSQRRILAAVTGREVPSLGQPLAPVEYLTELKALTVLLLHLATQPDADALCDWAQAARADRTRSTGTRTARWGLAPPTDPRLRGRALAAADDLLMSPDLEAAGDRFHPWTELTPRTSDGQLGWLADHTTMTPLLTRLVMAATATRRRIATLLDQSGAIHVPTTAIPQVLPADLYAQHLPGMLDITGATGRLYLSLCLARRHGGCRTWAAAATTLGLPAGTGTRTARACSADLLASPTHFVTAIDHVAAQLDRSLDYRGREAVVRRLAGRARWYPRWARIYHQGSHAASKRYAIAWLWTEHAQGLLALSPGWTNGAPGHRDRACYRRYTDRLTPAAKTALLAIVTPTQDRSNR